MAEWVDVCAVDEIDLEDVTEYDHAGKTIAVYRSPEGDVFATDGMCTHELAFLADGLVMGEEIECPMHNGRFNYKTGAALRAPACVALATYPARVRGGRIEIEI